MGIFSRISTLIRANVNDLISKAEDPQKILNQLIEDMEEQFSKAKSEVAMAIVDEKKLEREWSKNKTLSNEWEKRARVAASKSKDELALEALKRKRDYDDLVITLDGQLKEQKEVTSKLKESLRQLKNRIDEAKRKRSTLIAKAQTVKAKDAINKTFNNVNDHSLFSSFEKMERKVEAMDSKTQAYSDLDSFIAEDSVDKAFKDLEGKKYDDDLLAELRKLKGAEQNTKMDDVNLDKKEDVLNNDTLD